MGHRVLFAHHRRAALCSKKIILLRMRQMRYLKKMMKRSFLLDLKIAQGAVRFFIEGIVI